MTLYTPIGEHFGIVPLESMASSTAVVAMASGKILLKSRVITSFDVLTDVKAFLFSFTQYTALKIQLI